MISSKKSLCLLLSIYVLCSIQLSAKTTYYYKMVGKIHNKVKFTNLSGGQFITFAGNNSICFESNIKGNSVGNGQLVLKKNNEYNDYYGDSYWGSCTTFRFNENYTRLNVFLENGDVYIYDKSTPPSGVETSSLIRKTPKNQTSTETPAISLPPTTPINPIQSDPSPTYKTSKGHQCKLCKGKGRKIVEHYWGQSGDKTKWCYECNKRVGIAHTHKLCDSCGGKGWIEEY